LFNLAILSTEISFGQTASHASVMVQDPKPSLSICSTILSTRLFFSGAPCGNSARWATLADTKSIAELFLQAATQAPHPMHAAAAKDWSAFSFSTGIALPSTALPVFTEI